MLNNTRYLHIMLATDNLSSAEAWHPHLLKKKYPGEHVALVRSDLLESFKALDIFHEVHAIDLSFLQKSAFSPLLGDASAFNLFWEVVRPLSQMNWTRVFNLSGSKVDTSLASLFEANKVLGLVQQGSQTACADSPLKLSHTLKEWQLAHPFITTILERRTLNQLDLAPLEKSLQQVSDMKSLKGRGELQGVLVGVRLTEFSEDLTHNIDFLHHLFSLVALDANTAQALKARGYTFWDWSESDPAETFFLDLIVQDSSVTEHFWSRELNISDKDPEELTDRMADLLPKNFTKWACLSFMFDYLGQSKLALTSEKILTRYEKQALQPFLQQEVLTLKEFAKILLDGIRRQGQDHRNVLADYWAQHPGTLSFVAAIELSLQPSVVPMFRHDQDVIAVKNRMRTLNGFYERIHKACTLEIPKTDLALTL